MKARRAGAAPDSSLEDVDILDEEDPSRTLACENDSAYLLFRPKGSRQPPYAIAILRKTGRTHNRGKPGRVTLEVSSHVRSRRERTSRNLLLFPEYEEACHRHYKKDAVYTLDAKTDNARSNCTVIGKKHDSARYHQNLRYIEVPRQETIGDTNGTRKLCKCYVRQSFVVAIRIRPHASSFMQTDKKRVARTVAGSKTGFEKAFLVGMTREADMYLRYSQENRFECVRVCFKLTKINHMRLYTLLSGTFPVHTVG